MGRFKQTLRKRRAALAGHTARYIYDHTRAYKLTAPTTA